MLFPFIIFLFQTSAKRIWASELDFWNHTTTDHRCGTSIPSIFNFNFSIFHFNLTFGITLQQIIDVVPSSLLLSLPLPLFIMKMILHLALSSAFTLLLNKHLKHLIYNDPSKRSWHRFTDMHPCHSFDHSSK